jgi:hypothetical protein
MVGMAIVMFAVGILMFVISWPAIGAVCIALGASIQAINASLKKNHDHG